MRIAAGGDHLNRFRFDQPTLVDRAHREFVAAIGGCEQVAPGVIGRDIGHAVGKRRRCFLRERPGCRINRVGQYARRLRAYHGIEVLFVRAHCHRHDQLAGLGFADQCERAGARVHAVGVDIAVLRIRHIDECLGGTYRRHSKQQCQREARRSTPWRFHFDPPWACQRCGVLGAFGENAVHAPFAEHYKENPRALKKRLSALSTPRLRSRCRARRGT